MRKIITLLFFITLTSLAFAQRFSVSQAAVSGTGSYMSSGFDAQIRVYNLQASNLQLRWVRTQQLMPGSWRTAVCNESYCFPMSQDSAVFSMVPGDSDVVLMNFYPFGTPGSAVIQVKLYVVSDPSEFVMLTFYGETTLGVEERKEPEMVVYPNPFSTTVNVSFAIPVVKLRVLDVRGQELKTIEAFDHSTELTIDMHDLPAGCYFIEAQDEEGHQSVRKLLKQ